MLRVSINDRPHEFGEGLSVLDALRATGIHVPTLCHDQRLEPYGGCRLCLVEIEGHTRPATACTMPLGDGMQIRTHTPELEGLRHSLLRLLANRYPAEAYGAFHDKEFHRCIRDYHLEDELLRDETEVASSRTPQAALSLKDDSHPHIAVDMARCVYCYRCVRICEELQGQFVWRVWNRGDQTRILPDGPSLFESSCVSCGACVDTCPTGALEDKSIVSHGVPTAWTKTACPYCGTGCEMQVGTRDSRIVAVKPALEGPVNKGHLCSKGRYAFEFASAPDRITEPMIRDRGGWKRVSWDEAIAFTADRLSVLVRRHGPDSIAVLGSARATNEENYLAQKFARLVLGTNNVDCCARVCHAPSAAALRSAFGTGAATNSFDDIERARTILLCGANATENHPIVGARIKQAVLRGARLVVIDPRRIELAGYTSHHLALRPGTNVPLFNAMAHTVVVEELVDRAFVDARVSGWDDFARFISGCSPDQAALVCGVDAHSIRQAARLFATERPAISFHGLGMTEHLQGTDSVTTLINLALLTGNVGTGGSGVNPLRGQNNVQGAAHMGCDPSGLTGATPVREARERFEHAWGAPLPTTRGLNLLQMMDAAEAGSLKGLWTIGYDVFLTNPNATATARAFGALDLVVVQDLFLTETAKAFGTVFLPACSSFEKDGTFMNAERRIQRVRKVIEPQGQSKPDWQIICALGRQMGKGAHFDFGSPEEIWNEIRSVWSAGGGISYARIEQAGLMWPCTSEDDPGASILHQGSFTNGPRATLRCIEHAPTPELPTEEFPLVLVTGRTLHQFNAGTMTGRTANLQLRPTDLLDISPVDAERLRIRDGDHVRVVSRYGKAALPARVTDAQKPGEVFATFHTPGVFLNALTGPHRDRITDTPEYKITAVRVERIRDRA